MMLIQILNMFCKTKEILSTSKSTYNLITDKDNILSTLKLSLIKSCINIMKSSTIK